MSPTQGNTHVPIMKRLMTSEEWLAAVEAIIRRYRSHSVELGRRTPLTQEEAIAELRGLGLTAGDASRWLSATSAQKR